MIARHWTVRLVELLVLAILLAAPVAAGELDKLDTGFKLIPADAAFYSSMLRNREQFDALRNSNAWAKIQEMPVAQMGRALYEAQLATPGSRMATLAAVLQNPETRKIVDLAADMASDEVFVYGDTSSIAFLELFQAVNAAQSYGPLVMQAMQHAGQASGRDPSQFQGMAVLSALVQHADLIKIPNVVIGFKLKNTDLAKEQLIKLETMGNILLEANEHTKGHFKKTKVGDYDYLVLDLDGGMVPWDELPMERFKQMEAEEGDAQKVIDRLKAAKLVLALGLRDHYLVVSVGSSLEALEKLGKGDRLVDRPEMKPLEKFADKRLTSIGYASKALRHRANSQAENVDELLKLVDKLLPMFKLSDQQNKRIRSDAKELAEDIKTLIPALGAAAGISFLSERGMEGYQYAWDNHSRIDGSKPLSLLEHVGGRPIMGIANRGKVNVKDYDLAVRWAKTGYGYFEDFGLPTMPEAERAKAKKFLAAALPMLAKMDKANREMLIPALADGQTALVIDGKLQSKQFIAALPATEKPMPMVEPAIVLGVSDAKLLTQGMSEYRAAINGLIDAMRQVEGSNVPENVQLPAPQVSETSLGKVYSFPLPKEWGVDEKIIPNLGLSADVAVLSEPMDHTQRLLKATPLAADGVLAKADRPLAAAIWIDWVALIEAAAPWADFAVERSVAGGGIDDDQKKIVGDQVHTGLDVLKALRSISSEVYFEDEVQVGHTLLEISDVAK